MIKEPANTAAYSQPARRGATNPQATPRAHASTAEETATARYKANPPSGSQAGLRTPLRRLSPTGMASAQRENQSARASARADESPTSRAEAMPGATPNR